MLKNSSMKKKVRGKVGRVNEVFEYLKQNKEEIKKIEDEFSLFGNL